MKTVIKFLKSEKADNILTTGIFALMMLSALVLLVMTIVDSLTRIF